MDNYSLDLLGNHFSGQSRYDNSYSWRQYNPHPRSLWLQQGLDYNRLCDENHYNQGIRIHNEYLAHASDAQRQETIANLRNRLSNTIELKLIPNSICFMSLQDFPPLIRHMARYLEDRTSLDEIGATLSILTSTAAACCGRVIINILDSYSQPFILQMLGISESGTRKSELKRECCLPIYEWTDVVNIDTQGDSKINSIKAAYAKKFFQQRGRLILSKEFSSSDPCMTPYDIKRMQEIIDELVESQERMLASYAPVIERTIILDNATPARLIQAAEENGESISLFSAEGDVIPQFFNKTNDKFTKLVMRGYDHEEYVYQKYNKNYKFRHPSVSMMLLTQPEIALKLYQNKYSKDIGLTQRFIPWYFSHGFHLHIFDDKFEVMPDICERYNIKIKSLLDRFYTQDKNAPFCFINVEYGLRDKVNRYLKDMQNDAQFKNYGQGWFAKAGARAIRLACAIHFWNSDDPWNRSINEDEIKLGTDLLQYITTHVDFMYSPRGLAALETAKKIMGSIDRIEYPARNTILRDGITSTVIQQRTGLPKESVLNALDLLASCNHIALLDEGKTNVTVILRR